MIIVINTDVANKLNISIPSDLKENAKAITGGVN